MPVDEAIDLMMLEKTGSGYKPSSSEKTDLSDLDNLLRESKPQTPDELEKLIEEDAPVIDALSSYVMNCYHDASRSRYEEGIDERLLQNMRQYEGIYDPNERQLIQATGGSDNFRKITMAKCDAAAAWFIDILGGYKEAAFKVVPTEAPDLPEDTKDGILQNVRQLTEEHIQGMIDSGQLSTEAEIQEWAFNTMRNSLDEENDSVDEQAKWAAAQLQRLVTDQMQEGNWESAFEEFIRDFSIFINAFIKGPFIEMKKTKEWVKVDGRTKAKVSLKPRICFKRISPFDCYPSPEAENIQDADYFIERVKFSRQELGNMRKMAGYNEDRINQALLSNQYTILDPRSYNTDYTRAQLESKSYRVVDGGVEYYQHYEGLEFWGKVSGKHLFDWGLVQDNEGEVLDINDTYDVFAILVANQVVRAEINADPLGNKPYSKRGYKDVPGSFWSISLPETMQDIQRTCNSSVRGIENNQALSSGPMTMVDLAQLPNGEDITDIKPYKIFQIDSSRNLGVNSKAIEFFSVPNVSIPLMNVYHDFKKESDDVTGIPAYAHGDSQVGGAGNTASGLALLQGNATRGIKRVILGLGIHVIIDCVQRLIDFNMMYNPDESIKGDVQVTVDGPLSVIAKEFAAQMGMQFLQTTMNEFDNDLVGPVNRAKILEHVASTTLDIPGGVVLSQREIERNMIDSSNAQKQQQEMIQKLEEARMQLEAAKGDREQQSVDIDKFKEQSNAQNDRDSLDATVQMHDEDKALELYGLELQYDMENAALEVEEKKVKTSGE